MELPYQADEAASAALRRIGRTEDIQFSPDNRRLAIAGAKADMILILTVDMAEVPAGGPVRLADPMLLTCPDFDFPHGLFWLDDSRIVVANRNGLAPILDIPAPSKGSSQLDIAARLVIGREAIDRLVTPGSVTAIRLFDDVHDVLVCNNYAHTVSRHLVDLGPENRVLSSRILLTRDLDIPDGVAFSADARWIAASNHSHHCVHLYRNDPDLHAGKAPDGRLIGQAYPHGIRFAAGGRLLFVADAGAPYVHVYRSEDGDWSGDREPALALRVIDQDTFIRGQLNPQEGGPKGIDLTRDQKILVASCEHQPVTFHRVDDAIASLLPAGGAEAAPFLPPSDVAGFKALLRRQLAETRHDATALLAALEETRRGLAAQQEAHHALSQQHHDLSQRHHALAEAHHALNGAYHAATRPAGFSGLLARISQRLRDPKRGL
ncbi:MAG: hypothetical protein O9333_07005 [Beijerinckiaceae bacterium]|jgi:hypothetical protein|nr:hypothetical protein [Beijerinckiaceae bacterium]